MVNQREKAKTKEQKQAIDDKIVEFIDEAVSKNLITKKQAEETLDRIIKRIEKKKKVTKKKVKKKKAPAKKAAVKKSTKK